MMKRVLSLLLICCLLPVAALADGLVVDTEAEESRGRWPFFRWPQHLGNNPGGGNNDRDKGYGNTPGQKPGGNHDDEHEDEWNNGLDEDWFDQYSENTYRRTYQAKLLMRLATRSGPSTNYDELGSYFKEGQEITVISRAWDDRNDIWWVQVEFRYSDSLRRAYTGLKRVDIDVNLLPEERVLYSGRICAETIPYYGPGTHYRAHKTTVEYATMGAVYACENGWVQFEFYDAEQDCYRRVWLPEDCLDTHYYAGRR